MMNKDGQEGLFEVRINSLLDRAEKYECVCSKFLTPKEQIIAERIVLCRGADAVTFFYGGYDGGERRRLFALPSYLELDGCDRNGIEDVRIDFVTESISAVEIRGSGYKKLCHRDYLGSLLSLGLEREVVGDIAVRDDYSAVVFCDRRIVDFVLAELKKVGNDKVEVKPFDTPEDFSNEPKLSAFSDTVASARLDCVVASLGGISREKAQGTIKAGSVELDYFTVSDCDETVKEGSVISIRGVGKFKISSLSEQTKKGRLRLLANKYI